MRVTGLVWLGIPADDYTASVGFFRDVLGMDVAFDEGNTSGARASGATGLGFA
jgi:hypothetical protein